MAPFQSPDLFTART